MPTRARLRHPWKNVAAHHIDGNPRNNDMANLRAWMAKHGDDE